LQFGFVIREKLLVVLNGILGEAGLFHGLGQISAWESVKKLWQSSLRARRAQ
jgi:hypothetical protein